MKPLFLIDTDTASDDAVALIMALRSPQVRVLAITTVAGSVGGRDWIAVGRFLGPNISAHYRRYPLRWTVQAWRDAGMTDVGVREMSLGGGLVMWGTKSRV